MRSFRFRRILDLANRANASFYPVDPRGMVVFDEDIVPAAGVGAGPAANPTLTPDEDQGRLEARHTSLRTMADSTDGMAVLEMSDLDRGLRRITDDLSSVPPARLLLDSRHGRQVSHDQRAIETVRGCRFAPGRGTWRCSTHCAPLAPRSAVPAVSASILAVPGRRGLVDARSDRDLPMRLRAIAGLDRTWHAQRSGPSRKSAVPQRLTGALAETPTRCCIDSDRDDGRDRSARISTPGDQREPSALRARPVAGRVRDSDSRQGANATAAVERIGARLVASRPRKPAAVLFYRAGPGCGLRANARPPTLRFRRNERLRVAIPAPASVTVTARLLDRAGNPMPLSA